MSERAPTEPVGWAIRWGWNPPLWGEVGRSIWAPPRHRIHSIRRWYETVGPPVSLEEVVLHLRLDPAAVNGPEKPLLEMLTLSATRALEDYAQIAVMEQDWRMTLRNWPAVWTDGLELPFPPFRELFRIGVAGEWQDIADYRIELDEYRPARLFPARGYWGARYWPGRFDNILIDYRAGAAKPEDVPPPIKQAILMAIGTWYENRESVQQFTLSPMLEIGWRHLIEPYREPGFS